MTDHTNYVSQNQSQGNQGTLKERKTKVISSTDRSKGYIIWSQWDLKVLTRNRNQARLDHRDWFQLASALVRVKYGHSYHHWGYLPVIYTVITTSKYWGLRRKWPVTWKVLSWRIHKLNWKIVDPENNETFS